MTRLSMKREDDLEDLRKPIDPMKYSKIAQEAGLKSSPPRSLSSRLSQPLKTYTTLVDEAGKPISKVPIVRLTLQSPKTSATGNSNSSNER
jgi:hypothetical protein